jgi:hypothetical protein
LNIELHVPFNLAVVDIGAIDGATKVRLLLLAGKLDCEE